LKFLTRVKRQYFILLLQVVLQEHSYVQKIIKKEKGAYSYVRTTIFNEHNQCRKEGGGGGGGE
jgi:hypothetical protein